MTTTGSDAAAVGTLPPKKLVLRDDRLVWVRPVESADTEELQRAFALLSELSRYQRFHTGMPFLDDRLARFFTDVDHVRHEALVALPAPRSRTIVGVARFVMHQHREDEAELALAVAEAWRGRGLATALLHLLIGRARTEGIRRLTVEMLAENTAVRSLVQAAGGVCQPADAGVVSGHIALEQPNT